MELADGYLCRLDEELEQIKERQTNNRPPYFTVKFSRIFLPLLQWLPSFEGSGSSRLGGGGSKDAATNLKKLII